MASSSSSAAPAAAGGVPMAPQLGIGAFRDGKDLAKEVPDWAETVLLGECTHGTEEFYRLRAELTKYLIETKKFQVVIVEADWPLMWHVNQYIHRKKATMWPPGKKLTDQSRWLWRNKPFVELIEWMRKTERNCYLFGLDCQRSLEDSKQDLLKFLDFNDKDLARELRGACFPRDKPEVWPDILAKLQWGMSTAFSKPNEKKKKKAHS